MLTGIDHVVIAVPDLDEAMYGYRELGFTVVPGGRHPTGTHNALIGFSDGSYLELIAFERPVPEHKWWKWLQRGGGLTDVCLATDDLAADVTAFRGAGITINDPSPLSRLRPDGYKLEWRLAIPDVTGAGVIPFLIEDETPREERVPKETSHTNGVAGIRGLVIAVEDASQVGAWYANALSDSGQPIEIAELAAAGTRFNVGPHRFDIASPTDREGPVARWLRDRGPSIYSLSLRTAPGTERVRSQLALPAALIEIC